MDPALLKERELFKKRALTTPTVETKKKSENSTPLSQSKDDSKKSRPRPASSGPKLDATTYKTMTGSSNYKFGVLAKIVRHLKARHQDGDDHPLSLEELLDETNQLDVGNKVKQWLLNEALIRNPKVEVTPEQKFLFKPPYKVRDKKSMLKLLKHHDLKGMGGILLEDIQESLPNCEKILRILNNEIIYIQRPMDKKKILFYNDRTANLSIDEEFQKLWRAVAVESMDDQKIEEYLEKQGIKSMQDHNLKKLAAPIKRKKVAKKRTFKKPRDNEHLADVLQTYDDK
ncbi:transcription initiation factor IIE subunit beta, putative [Pediculus humanus corporis]|uniref:Transcription initiation factor IIE subunit beta n=1 Tax=Pediculus humanus subsp. corporis TaxID=121224 RepID=E0VXJ2_PEDHC|nr:transcription initiation factor IIE subunit beta, putative [Pediculus humanus corporis]EEB18098.1 transcription initiation factor IIE subunit beta, putative [Pediculus humanus corporis]